MKTYRGKIKLFLGLCLAFLASVTMLYIANSFDLYHRLVTVERFDDLLDDILELRRYEKNLLFMQDMQSLDKISLYLKKTENTYHELADTIIRLKGRREYEIFGKDLEKYKSLLQKAWQPRPLILRAAMLTPFGYMPGSWLMMPPNLHASSARAAGKFCTD